MSRINPEQVAELEPIEECYREVTIPMPGGWEMTVGANGFSALRGDGTKVLVTGAGVARALESMGRSTHALIASQSETIRQRDATIREQAETIKRLEADLESINLLAEVVSMDEVRALRLDATRYRHFCGSSRELCFNGWSHFSKDAFDAAIDAAIQQQRGEG